MLAEIDKLTEWFGIVTSNLVAHYKYATETICEGFVDKEHNGY